METSELRLQKHESRQDNQQHNKRLVSKLLKGIQIILHLISACLDIIIMLG